MKYQIQLFFTALTFFTRIPCAAWGKHEEADLNRSTRYFPLVGIVVGALVALVFYISAILLPQGLAILLSMVASLMLTGAFHEDGLSDAVDGLGGGWEKEQVLAIMKDSRIGNYGASALFMALLLKFEALAALPATLIPAVLIAAHALSRLSAASLILTQEYVRENGKAKPLATQMTSPEFALCAAFGLAPLYWLPLPALWALLPVLLVRWWFGRLLQKKLGGYTGDCLGAMQQLSELAFYLGIVACISR
ncbi:MAG: adenosylcobinamide-GDP ribazoletransferase [Methylophilaceae bacterium]